MTRTEIETARGSHLRCMSGQPCPDCGDPAAWRNETTKTTVHTQAPTKEPCTRERGTRS